LRENLAALLTEAINRLEEAVKGLMDKDERTLYNNVWKAASDIEYSIFLIALSRENGNDEWKKQWKVSRDGEIAATLLTAKDLLRKAVEALNSDEEEAYRKAWFARGYVLDIQSRLDKDRAKRPKPQRPA
jgi:hypothetical protein